MDTAVVDRLDPAAVGDDTGNRAAVRRVRRPLESSGNGSTLPPELMEEVSRRLGTLALVYASAVLFDYFGRRALLTWTGAIEPGLQAADVVRFLAMLSAIAVWAVLRRGIVP